MRKWFLTSLYLHIIALANGVWQSWMHFEGATKGCSSTGAITCDVMFSSYGYWFNVPTPFLALAFYTVSLCITIFAWREENPEEQKKWTAGAVVMSWLGSLTALYFAIVSFGVLKKFCPYCCVFYAVAIALFFVTRTLRKLALGDSKLTPSLSGLFKNPRLWGSCFIGLVVLGGLIFSYKPKSHLANDKYTIIGDESRTVGVSSARFHIAEFSDFQCPHCKKIGAVLKQLEREEQGSVKITYKFYPLDPKCNSKMPPPGHAFSCEAAYGAYCAGKQGKFWVYHDLIFANQDDLNSSLWKSFAEQAGLDIPAFDACMASKEADAAVRKDIQEGDALNVEGTPTLFINGQKFEGDRSLEGIKAFLKTL